MQTVQIQSLQMQTLHPNSQALTIESLQGDQEKELGLPISPLFDRTKPGVTKSQVSCTGSCTKV